MTIEAVVFDLDGTLADFNIDYKAVRADARSFLIKKGLPASILSTNESIFEMLKKAEIFLKNNGKSSAINEIFTVVLAIAEKYELEAAKETDILPGVPETLRALKNMGLRIGLFTVNGEKSTRYILNRFRMVNFFDAVIPRDNIKHVKPSREHLEAVLKTLRVKPEKAVVVGDGVNDMICGHELNVLTIGLTTGISSPKDLIGSGADYIITSLTDLPALIKQVKKLR